MKNIYSIIALVIFSFLFFASNSVKRLTYDANTYVNVSRADHKDTTVTYTIPSINLIENTKQEQTKGGITITCQIVPFVVNKETSTVSSVFWADPAKPGYDVFQTALLPYYTVSPNQLKFNLKIKNKQDHLLKMRDVALAVLNDGLEYKVPRQYMDEEWQAGNVMSGFEKNFEIPGPSIAELKAGKVIEIVINDVPVDYDAAGNVYRRANFNWTFVVNTKTESKNEAIAYRYESRPVRKEQCLACSGSGKVMVNCSICNGTGKYKGFDGKIYACSSCNSTGRVQANCRGCAGLGFLTFPQSSNPRVTSSVHWSGYWVDVISKPAGAAIQVVDPAKDQYVYVNSASNCRVQWYRSPTQTYPIILEYQGQKVKVLPYKNGKDFPKVKVDFTTTPPTIQVGQAAN